MIERVFVVLLIICLLHHLTGSVSSVFPNHARKLQYWSSSSLHDNGASAAEDSQEAVPVVRFHAYDYQMSQKGDVANVTMSMVSELKAMLRRQSSAALQQTTTARGDTLQLRYVSLQDKDWLEVFHHQDDQAWKEVDFASIDTHASPMFYRILAKHFLANLTKLQSLSFQHQVIPATQMRLIIQALRKHPHLQKVRFAQCHLTSEAMEYVGILLKLRPSITHLDLQNNNLDEQGLKVLTSSWNEGNGKNVEYLDLSFNSKLGKHLTSLSEVIRSGKLPNLKTLVLREVCATQASLTELFEALADSTVSLQYLDVSGNAIATTSSSTSGSASEKSSFISKKLNKVLPNSFLKALDSVADNILNPNQSKDAQTILCSDSLVKSDSKIHTSTGKKYRRKLPQEAQFKQTSIRLPAKSMKSKKAHATKRRLNTTPKSAKQHKAKLTCNQKYRFCQSFLNLLQKKKSSLQALSLNKMNWNDDISTLLCQIIEKEYQVKKTEDVESAAVILSTEWKLNPNLSSSCLDNLQKALKDL